MHWCVRCLLASMPSWPAGSEGLTPPGKERAQPLSLTDSLPHLGTPPLGPANLALVSPETAALSTGLLGRDNILFFFFNPKTVDAAKPPVYSSCIQTF